MASGIASCFFQGFLLELTAANGLLKTMEAFFYGLEAGDGVAGSG